MVSVGVIAVNGTKLHANASMSANRSYEKITQEILAEAAAADAEEDAQLGELRGDELPAHLVGRSSRKARLEAAKERLEHEVKVAQNTHRERVKERTALERERGSRLRGRKPKAPARRVGPAARANLTDQDSRLIRGPKGFLQGYNAQAATSASQIILAAELSTDSPDGRSPEPMVDATRAELRAAGTAEQPGVVLADAVFAHTKVIRRAERFQRLRGTPTSSFGSCWRICVWLVLRMRRVWCVFSCGMP